MAMVSKGFTLLELLVTISIIGILLAIGSTSFSTAQKKGRDSRRQADMTSIQKALEQCYSVDTKYPSVSSGAVLQCPTSLQTVMNLVPSDPKGGAGYSYVYTNNGATATAYCLCGTMENIGTGNASSDGSAGGGSCSFVSGGNYFCVSNQQ